jgi:hypothetical protein
MSIGAFAQTRAKFGRFFSHRENQKIRPVLFPGSLIFRHARGSGHPNILDFRLRGNDIRFTTTQRPGEEEVSE